MDPFTLLSIGKGVLGFFQGLDAKAKAKVAQSRADAIGRKIENFARQEIIDPYAEIQDRSAMITNPFSNIQVATQAAELQAEQADISLASTLDTLRSTGASAGGATALAQAAARSKQGISASIEQQEVQNARLRAQGQQNQQQMMLAEQARIQSARAQGKAFVFGQQETRDIAELDRLQSLQDQQRANQLSYGQAASAGFGQALGAATAFGASYLGGTNPFTGNPTGTTLSNSGARLNTGAINRLIQMDSTNPNSASNYYGQTGTV